MGPDTPPHTLYDFHDFEKLYFFISIFFICSLSARLNFMKSFPITRHPLHFQKNSTFQLGVLILFEI